ncbi:hypothetical protein HBB16_13795 [Pseudonocardia sp. MCCB 268]|nr:hypothetical protein [Pseudonocardia cytotoxica]
MGAIRPPESGPRCRSSTSGVAADRKTDCPGCYRWVAPGTADLACSRDDTSRPGRPSEHGIEVARTWSPPGTGAWSPARHGHRQHPRGRPDLRLHGADPAAVTGRQYRHRRRRWPARPRSCAARSSGTGEPGRPSRARRDRRVRARRAGRVRARRGRAAPWCCSTASSPGPPRWWLRRSLTCPGTAWPGTRSAEPGGHVVLEHLGLAPLLELDMRLVRHRRALLAAGAAEAARAMTASRPSTARVTDKTDG